MNSNTTAQRLGGSKEIARGAPPRPAPPAQSAAPADGPHYVYAKIVDDATGQPLGNARYEVVDERGAVVAGGTTDWQAVVRHEVPAGGTYTVRVVE